MFKWKLRKLQGWFQRDRPHSEGGRETSPMQKAFLSQKPKTLVKGETLAWAGKGPVRSEEKNDAILGGGVEKTLGIMRDGSI